MPANEQQINISYVAAEDRLLIKVNTGREEFRVWLTCRFTRILLEVLNEQLSVLGATTESSSQELAGKLKEGVFSRNYAPGESLPQALGENGILAYKIKVSKPSAGFINMLLLPQTGKGLNLKLDRTKLGLLSNLLEQALPSTGWQLSSTQVSPKLMH